MRDFAWIVMGYKERVVILACSCIVNKTVVRTGFVYEFSSREWVYSFRKKQTWTCFLFGENTIGYLKKILNLWRNNQKIPGILNNIKSYSRKRVILDIIKHHHLYSKLSQIFNWKQGRRTYFGFTRSLNWILWDSLLSHHSMSFWLLSLYPAINSVKWNDFRNILLYQILIHYRKFPHLFEVLFWVRYIFWS